VGVHYSRISQLISYYEEEGTPANMFTHVNMRNLGVSAPTREEAKTIGARLGKSSKKLGKTLKNSEILLPWRKTTHLTLLRLLFHEFYELIAAVVLAAEQSAHVFFRVIKCFAAPGTCA
jgi:hypothetical protein